VNIRWLKFVDAYVQGGNATQAYIDAGFSPKGAGASAHKLLKKPQIVEAIASKAREVSDAVGVDTAWVLTQAVSLYESCVDLHSVYDTNGKLVGQKLADAPSAIRALTLVSRYTGGFEAKTEVSGPNGGAIPHVVAVAVAEMTTAQLREALAQPTDTVGEVEGPQDLAKSEAGARERGVALAVLGDDAQHRTRSARSPA
jgi:hypothetical protein